MVEASKEEFHEYYTGGFPNRVKMEIGIENTRYTIRCEVDSMGNEDQLLFDTIDAPTNRWENNTLDYDDITKLVAALVFAEDFAADRGYEFRGPRVGIE